MAEAYGKAGQAEEGLLALTEALTLVTKTGERQSEAEIYRLKGELTLQKSGVRHPTSDITNSPESKVQGPESSKTKSQSRNPSSQAEGEAEACFLKAIEIAQRQQAKSWELRAATSLARLWQQQGKQKEAHELLAEIYGWFTEGFDTKDLQEAKALLDELAGEQ